jgi:hypothetical protein
MTSRWPSSVRLTLQVTAIACLGLAGGVLVAITTSDGSLPLFLGALVAAGVLAGLFLLPIRFLPAITLLVTLLVPTEASFFPHELQGAVLGIVPFAVWLFRAPSSPTPPTGLRLLASLLGVWLVVSAALAPLHTHKGLEWLVTVGLALVFAIVSAPMGLNARAFRALFINVASLLGLYAVVEGFVLHRNLLFGALFEHTSWWSSQHYNASYRVTTLLGHPLVNGLVFSAAAVLAASELTRSPRRPLLAWVQFGILVGATDATRSRSAAIALAVGVLTVLIFTKTRGPRRGHRRLSLLISIVAAGALLAYGLAARNESREGQQSAQVREALISRALEAVRSAGPFGAGPGESEAYRRSLRLPGWTVDLENSYAQLAVSLGYLGLLLMVALLFAVIVIGLHNSAVIGEAAALLTILVDIAGFNAIEGHPDVGLLIALLAIAVITAPRTLYPDPLNATSLGESGLLPVPRAPTPAAPPTGSGQV